MLLAVMVKIHEPHNGLQILACMRLIEALLPYLGSWQSDYSDMVVKELKTRIYDYGEQLKPAPPIGLRPVFTGIEEPTTGEV